jgi:dTDP-glucose 4,6-dehydratase
VIGLAIPSDVSFKNYNSYLSGKKRYRQVWGSINDKDLVERIVSGVNVVFHLAAKINVDESIYDFENFYKTNIIGTSNILEACRKSNVKMIQTSTCEVMGENLDGKPMKEDRPLLPHSPYAASKCAAERMCYAYYKTHDLDVKIVRPFNLYGERQKRYGAGAMIPIFFEKAINDEDIVVNGDGKQERDYIHVSDIVRAYLHILNHPEYTGKIVHVGCGVPRSVIDIAEKIVKIVGKGRIVHGPARKGEVTTFMADSSFIQSNGFKLTVDFDEGLERYYQWRVGGTGKTQAEQGWPWGC